MVCEILIFFFYFSKARWIFHLSILCICRLHPRANSLSISENDISYDIFFIQPRYIFRENIGEISLKKKIYIYFFYSFEKLFILSKTVLSHLWYNFLYKRLKFAECLWLDKYFEFYN